ncbi:MAG: hypothetical protein KKB20_09680 [Proteobacteria bacterium]|nr:hypothetical protein [Pseudomonadota bacterium]
MPGTDPAAAWADGLDRVLNWSRGQDYAGYSKFDAFNSPIVRALVPDRHLIRAVTCALWARQPVNLRPLFRTTRSRNPKGIALFALAWLRRHRWRSDPADLDEALRLLAWLEEHHVPGYSGKCWGYDHDWYGLHFYAPKDSPNIVVTGNVALAFLEAFETTGRAGYLDTARSSVEFMLKDLDAPVDEPGQRNIGYVPGSSWGVLNVNGLAASVMIRVWRHTGEPLLKEEAGRLTAFLVDKQTDYGAWHYAWPAGTSNVKHDNYHTGNVLDWVLDYTRESGDQRFLGAYAKGLSFYVDHLFLPDGAPKWMSDRVHPLDAHSAAQAVVTLAKAARQFDSSYIEPAGRTATWALNHLQAPEGYFYYQRGRHFTRRYTLMRWCNAWMALALASLLPARREV